MKNNITQILLATASLCFAGSASADHHNDEDCPGPSKMKLDVGLYSLNLQAKKPICVFIGGTFSIRIKEGNDLEDPVEAGEARVVQKEGSTLTITGDNSANAEFIVITVTGSAVPDDGIGQFNIYVDDVGYLDPKVRIVESNIVRRLQYEHARNALNELGIDFGYLTEVFREFDNGPANTD